MDICHQYHFTHPPEDVYALYSSEDFIRFRFADSGITTFDLSSEDMPEGRRLQATLPVTETLGKARWAARAIGLNQLVLDYQITWHTADSANSITAHYRYAPRQVNAAIQGHLKLTPTQNDTPHPGTKLVHTARLESALGGPPVRWLTDWILKRVRKEFDADMAKMEKVLRTGQL